MTCMTLCTQACTGLSLDKVAVVLQIGFANADWAVCACPQVAEHKRAVDKMLEEKRAIFEAARAAEEQEEAAR